MRKTTLLLCSLLIFASGCTGVRLQQIGEGYAATSVNTCIFRGASLTSDANYRVAAFYDAGGHVMLALMKRGEREWTVSDTGLSGRVEDAHNVISIAIDGDGYIHMSFDQHSSPMRYTRSVEPYSAVFPSMTGGMLERDEEKVTYPEFHRLHDGDLLFFYRNGASGNGDLVLNRYYTQENRWERVQDVLIDGEGQRNAYPQMYVDAADNIHLSWVWRESYMVETNHDMCYACSRDCGRTWTRTDGSICEIPITATNAEYAAHIPQGSELMNQTSMTADSEGHPYIATYWRDPESTVPQYRIIWHDGKQWRNRQVGERSLAFSLSGGGTKAVPMSRPRLAVTAKGPVYIFRDEERGWKVSAYTAKDIKKSIWDVVDLTDFSVGLWEPSIDEDALKRNGSLSIFVQKSGQGDGESLSDCPPQPVYVMDYR